MGTALPFLQLMFIFYAPSSTTTLFFATQLVVTVLTSHTAMAYIVCASTRHAVWLGMEWNQARWWLWILHLRMFLVFT